MAVTVSVAVMAHPDRRHLVDRLVQRLDRPATVVFDECNSEWDTARRAWLAFDPDATHHLVLQDDAVACRDLAAGIEAALTYVPADSALSLYLGRVTPKRAEVERLAAEAGDTTSWITIDGLHWGVGVVLPSAFVTDMVAWCDRNSAKYDARVSKWLASRHLTTWYPWPNLVDHLDGPSLIPGHGRRPGRRSHRFLGEGASALDVDWSGAVLHTGTLGVTARPPRQRPSRRDPMPPAQVVSVSGDVYVACQNARVKVDGRPVRIIRGRTHAHADSWIVRQRPQLWRPLVIEFPAETTPTVDDPDPGSADASPKPVAKDVRAWAKENGIDVPARGPIPDDVIDRYQAAHATADSDEE